MVEAIADLLPIARLPPGHDPRDRSGSGGDVVETITDLLSIARLPPGHDPGAGYGVATAARQRWHLRAWPSDILDCSAARWPPRTTSPRANARTKPAHDQADETAPPGHSGDFSNYAFMVRGSSRLKQITAKTNEIIAKIATNLKYVKLNMSGHDSNICKQHSDKFRADLKKSNILQDANECSEMLQQSNFWIRQRKEYFRILVRSLCDRF